MDKVSLMACIMFVMASRHLFLLANALPHNSFSGAFKTKSVRYLKLVVRQREIGTSVESKQQVGQ